MDDLFITLFNNLYDDIKDDIRNDHEKKSSIIKKYDVVIRTFNTEHYFNDLLLSYNNDEDEIWRQFDLDCGRTDIILNNQKCKTQDEFIESIDNLKKYKMDDYYYRNINMTGMLGLLCNQSSYALSYNECHHLFADPDNNIYVFNMSSNRFIKISIKDNKINVQISANYKLMDINNVITLGIIETCITLDAIITENNVHFLNGVLEWNFL